MAYGEEVCAVIVRALPKHYRGVYWYGEWDEGGIGDLDGL